MIQPRLSTRNICSEQPGRDQRHRQPVELEARARGRCGRRRPASSTATPTTSSPNATRNGNRRGPIAALAGATSRSEVSIATNRPKPSTTPPSTASPIRRPQPVVIRRILPVVRPGLCTRPTSRRMPSIRARSGPRNAANSSAGWYMSTQPRSLSSACHSIAADHLAHRRVQRRPCRRGRILAGAISPRQLTSVDVDALLLEGRDVDARQPLRRGDADRPQLAGLDLLRHLVETAGRDGEVAAHDLRQHLAAGAGDDVVHLGDVPARRLDDQRAQDVVGASPGRTRPS